MKRRTGKLVFHGLGVIAILLAGLFACAGFMTSTALAQTAPSTITIDAPGAANTVATAINASGVIAGLYFDSSGGGHGFVRSPDGTFVSFDSPLGPAYIYTTSINGAGIMTGFYLDGNFGAFGGSHGFVRTPDGVITSFDAPVDPSNPMPGTNPYSINSEGQVAGTYSVNCSAAQLAISPPVFPPCNDGFLRQPDGTIATFDTPDLQGSMLAAFMNATGRIAGYFLDGNTSTLHSFLRAVDGTFAVIDVPGSMSTSAVAINSRGETAGNTTINYIPRNFVRSAVGTVAVFDPLGACPGSFHLAYALNDRGTVVGVYNDCIHPANYTFVFLRFADETFASFFPGFTSGFPLVAGINSSNAVVGTYQDANGGLHGYLRPGGQN